MKIDYDVYKNIANTYHTFFTDIKGLSIKDDTIKAAKLFLNFFDMSYDNGIMKDLTKHNEDVMCKVSLSKITPFKLSQKDEEDLCRMITKNSSDIQELCPLFDCIGYLLINDEGRYHIVFKGNYTYEIWKDFWQYDSLNLNNKVDWKSLDDDFSKYDLSSIKWLK